MKNLSQKSLKRWILLILIPILSFNSCREEDNGFPITNDLRVLYVSVNGNRAASGLAGVAVTSDVRMIFSHGLDKTVFENALSVTPALNYSLVYDENNSFVTIVPDVRLEYDVTYTINLPKGIYGVNGESSAENFTYQFSTGEFTPPTITLTPDNLSFFEGETVTIKASINEPVFVDVSFDIEYSGSAQGAGVDYTPSLTSITIPSGQTEATFTVTAIEGDAIEGNENIIISLINITNGVYSPASPHELQLGDRAPSIELKGVMHLRTSSNGNGVRAIHLSVLKDIADLSTYGIEINSNGSTTPIDPAGLDYFFPAVSVTAGQQILLVRDLDAVNAANYFGSCFSGFDLVIESTAMTHNGDDAILLYNDGVAIETYGELAVDGTGMPWEYTGSWAYKLGSKWINGLLNCANNVDTGTTLNSSCVYPMCSEGLEFVGIMSMLPTQGRIRAYHLRALTDIPDLSIYGAGIASNGQAFSDGVEISFPSVSVKEGENILVIRDLDVNNASSYFGNCYQIFDHVVADGNVTSNGDDTIELFKNGNLIETYGALGVDGTGMIWDYTDSWAAKVGGSWQYGGAGCTSGATDNASSSCSYILCD